MDRDYVCSDPYWSLVEWRDKVNQWIEQYGEDSVLMTDTGYTDGVDLIIYSRRKCSLCGGSKQLPDEFGDGNPPGICPKCKGV